MQIDTFRDIIHWTQAYHHQLAESLKHSSDANQNEKARLLLDYLSEHEAKLAKAVSAFEHSDNVKALNTWVMEYLDKTPILPDAEIKAPYADLSSDEIIRRIETEHSNIIELYKFLAGRAVATPAVDLLEELAALEKHEAMRVSSASNMLGDL
ncbi:hypothetical protein GCM10011352_41760 [Marinobacterium zhoushanense]|uniref:ATPase n=1 Tax=Marinobacterium zhoushanense TaxID=1679163 RepID=A0ABQ1KXD5_9GAMM|nr:ATPase [Marinobacterium zhoushanense]GGC10909.1 hypothetical protein GCM10011352_41760 [Marinobacterium zhoushanense]